MQTTRKEKLSKSKIDILNGNKEDITGMKYNTGPIKKEHRNIHRTKKGSRN